MNRFSAFRWKIDQAAGNFPGLPECSETAGNFCNEPCQLLDCLAVAKRRKPTCLLPGIEAETRQGRHHGQRYSIDLITNRREQKLVEIGPQRTKRPAQCHCAAADAKSAISCPEAMFVSPSVLRTVQLTLTRLVAEMLMSLQMGPDFELATASDRKSPIQINTVYSLVVLEYFIKHCSIHTNTPWTTV